MTVTFYLDESTSVSELVVKLKNDEFYVKTAVTEDLLDVSDDVRIEFAVYNKYILLTDNKRLEPILQRLNRPGMFIIN